MNHTPPPAWLVCIPAYGKKLTTSAQIIDYYNQGKDFRTLGIKSTATYISCRQATKFNITLEVRYGSTLQHLHIIPPTQGDQS